MDWTVISVLSVISVSEWPKNYLEEYWCCFCFRFSSRQQKIADLVAVGNLALGAKLKSGALLNPGLGDVFVPVN